MSNINMTVTEMQKLLKQKGFYKGRIDGIRGPKTNAALSEFKKSIGFNPRPLLGPLTRTALRLGVIAAAAKPTPRSKHDMPPWLRLAYGFLGLREIRGAKHNKEILKWWEALGLHFRDDETPWCAAFMNRMVQLSGLRIPDKYRAAALGWKWSGYGVRLNGPALGAIMIMERPGKPGSGHTTFVAGRDKRGRIQGIGGNQGNAVSINPYDEHARNAAYYWPEGHPLPDRVGLKYLPIINKSGATLRNEA